MGEIHDPGQWGDLFIGPQAQVIGADQTARFHRCRLHDDQANAAEGVGAIMDVVEIVGQTSVLVGAVHAHRRHHDTVPEGEFSEGVGRK